MRLVFNFFEETFAPGRRHVAEERKRLELTRLDVLAGDPARGPIDLASGKVVVRAPGHDDGPPAERDTPPETDGAPAAGADQGPAAWTAPRGVPGTGPGADAVPRGEPDTGPHSGPGTGS